MTSCRCDEAVDWAGSSQPWSIVKVLRNLKPAQILLLGIERKRSALRMRGFLNFAPAPFVICF